MGGYAPEKLFPDIFVLGLFHRQLLMDAKNLNMNSVLGAVGPGMGIPNGLGDVCLNMEIHVILCVCSIYIFKDHTWSVYLTYRI